MVEIDTLFQTKRLKNHTFGAEHTYIAYIRDYPPPSGGEAKNAFQIMSLAAFASETNKTNNGQKILKAPGLYLVARLCC